MSRATHVYIVASPRARTGKTLLARLVSEFHLSEGRPIAAFDLDTTEATFAQFLPQVAKRADIGDTRGQIALFDRLIVDDAVPKIVDVSAHTFDPFFKVMSEIDFAGEARLQSVKPVILFAANPDPLSAKSYLRLAQTFPHVALTPVYNDEIARGLFVRDRFPALNAIGLPLRLPILSPNLRKIVETVPFSFTQFRRSTGLLSETLESELSSWLKRIYLQFRELELRLLLSNLSGSLTQPIADQAQSQPQA
jgi:hypothetical protein